MIKITKVLSVIIFKRYFETNKFILFFPKLTVKTLNLINYTNLKKYILEYSYKFDLNGYHVSNLISITYINKNIFFKVLNKHYSKLFGIKCNNIFFTPTFLITYKQLFLFSLKKFLFQLKYIFFINLKYLYSFLRIYSQ